jgi:hypothetical protein
MKLTKILSKKISEVYYYFMQTKSTLTSDDAVEDKWNRNCSGICYTVLPDGEFKLTIPDLSSVERFIIQC